MAIQQTMMTKSIELSWPHPPKKWWRKRQLNVPVIGLTTLALLVGALMLIVPAYLLLRTLGAGDAFFNLLQKTSTWQTLGRTVWLAGTVTIASAALAVPLAWLTVCTDLPGRRFWSVVIALPLVLPSYVAAYLLVSWVGPKGLLQQMLAPLTGIERLPEIYGFTGAFLTLTLMSYPYTFLTVRAAFKRMDPSLAEAARSLGHSPWQAFRRVTLPHLRPSIMAGSLLVVLYVLRDFGAVTMLRYNTFTRMIYIQYQSFASRSVAAALALLLVGLTAVILYFELRTRGHALNYARKSIGSARQPKRVALGLWRWPALLLISGVVLVALVFPALSLGYWLLRGIANGQTLAVLWQSAWHSVGVSLLTALVAIVAALPVTILSVRRPNRLNRFLEQLTYAGYALPGIVIALAFVFFGANYAPALYQTLPLLVVAYIVLFVPQAVGATRTSLLQVPQTLEEAGRTLGCKPSGVFQRVTLPLLRPGMLAGAGLVFLTCMKELPATLILSPTGFNTLATAVWSNISEAFFAQAAAPTLMLLLLASVPLAILTFRDK